MAAVIGTVDLVVVGTGSAAVAAAVDATRHGRRVAVLIRSPRPTLAARFRRSWHRLASTRRGLLTILTGVEVVCVAGVGSVEAVVIRRIRSGRLVAVNATSLVSF